MVKRNLKITRSDEAIAQMVKIVDEHSPKETIENLWKAILLYDLEKSKDE
ncbi:hypothetical protein [Jeotgalibacillus sp. S-D1]|nr:hypothetical protein [Jeotgalibacillus sp. S-D1]